MAFKKGARHAHRGGESLLGDLVLIGIELGTRDGICVCWPDSVHEGSY